MSIYFCPLFWISYRFIAVNIGTPNNWYYIGFVAIAEIDTQYTEFPYTNELGEALKMDVRGRSHAEHAKTRDVRV